jgi:DNA-binding response OmpR family regulator
MDVARTISRVHELCREDRSPKLLWVDLRRGRSMNPASGSVAGFYRVNRVCDVAAISRAVHECMPHVLCFDFDVPDPLGLCAMRQLKHRHCNIPVLMLTEYHSKELALFAFRSRAEDHLIKPVTTRLLLSTLRAVFERECARYPSFSNARWKQARYKTHRALTFVETNVGMRIDLATVAD